MSLKITVTDPTLDDLAAFVTTARLSDIPGGRRVRLGPTTTPVAFSLTLSAPPKAAVSRG